MSTRASLLNQLAALATTLNDSVEQALTAQFQRPMNDVATLLSVRHCNTFTVGWLSSVLGVTHSAAVRIADRLSAEGLLQRTEGPNKRYVGLVATEDGKKLADEIMAIRRQTLEQLLTGLDQELQAAAPLIQTVLTRATKDQLSAYQRCRYCDESMCGVCEGLCPVENAESKQG